MSITQNTSYTSNYHKILRVLPHLYDMYDFTCDITEYINEYDLDDDDFVFVFTGNLLPENMANIHESLNKIEVLLDFMNIDIIDIFTSDADNDIDQKNIYNKFNLSFLNIFIPMADKLEQANEYINKREPQKAYFIANMHEIMWSHIMVLCNIVTKESDDEYRFKCTYQFVADYVNIGKWYNFNELPVFDIDVVLTHREMNIFYTYMHLCTPFKMIDEETIVKPYYKYTRKTNDKTPYLGINNIVCSNDSSIVGVNYVDHVNIHILTNPKINEQYDYTPARMNTYKQRCYDIVIE